MPESFPQPEPMAAAHSCRLAAIIRDEIAACGGWLAFDRFMELALYAPGFGYYSAGSVKLGSAGDFTTAPEISPLFGRVLAAQLRDLLSPIDAPVILEIGAGTGVLAKSILDTLAECAALPAEYWILELSADLKSRQQEMLEPHAARVSWLNALPADPCEGVVLANEVADALPVTVFVKDRATVRPLGVTCRDGEFAWAQGPGDAVLEAAVAALEAKLGGALPSGYRSELCLRLDPWIASLAAPLARGALLLIDYGLVRREYYHAARAGGTLVCHYRHRAHGNPLVLPGLQDISAWVDFSACADAAHASGLDVAGFTTQAQFLLASRVTDMLAAFTGREQLLHAQALKTLTLPGEMGERFKLMLLSRGLPGGLPGRDFRDRL
jgi:SAM-dependent MidA family methyltransferase